MTKHYEQLRKEYLETGDIMLDKWPTPAQDGIEARSKEEEEQAFSA
jgi:hypothetical protein